MDPGERCMCEKSSEPSQESDSSTSESPCAKEKRSNKISLTSLGLNLRRGRSLQFKPKRSKKSAQSASPACASSSTPTLKSPKWGLRFNCTKREPKETAVHSDETSSCCKCTHYRRTEEQNLSAGMIYEPEPQQIAMNEEETWDVAPEPAKMNEEVVAEASGGGASQEPKQQQQQPQPLLEQEVYRECDAAGLYGRNKGPAVVFHEPMIQWVSSAHEDCDEAARRQRAREIERGVDPPADFTPVRRVQLLCSDVEAGDGRAAPRRLQLVCPSDLSVESLRALFQNHVTLRSCPLDSIAGCHTQVDFMHCLVPDLYSITNCSFYWGKMDRYEAESLLDGKPEGTFLLRDSAQEEFLFSVSFRKYGRSLHARIEQWNHKFSFDSHDPGVYTSDTVCGLIEHYKDPSSCMFFEPMLTWPLHRSSTFTLQHLCRATITRSLTYDNVAKLQLPRTLKTYLKEYHYRQKVRVERFDDDLQWLDLRTAPPHAK